MTFNSDVVTRNYSDETITGFEDYDNYSLRSVSFHPSLALIKTFSKFDAACMINETVENIENLLDEDDLVRPNNQGMEFFYGQNREPEVNDPSRRQCQCLLKKHKQNKGQ